MLGPVLEALTNAHPSSNKTLTPSKVKVLYFLSLVYEFISSITLNFILSDALILISGVE